MRMIDRGHGTPLVLIPGIQGHWEWMMPAVRALARRCRVLTFSLGEAGRDPAVVFDRWTAIVDAIAGRAGDAPVAVAGVSFGGLIAYRYARLRGARVSKLILVSAPAPDMRLDPRVDGYLRHPHLSVPLFGLRSGLALWPEVRSARPTLGGQLRLALDYLRWPLTRPISPGAMATWIQAWRATDVAGDGEPVHVPTLIVTGEPSLDLAVPVSSTLEYMRLVPGARHVTLSRTGHIGLVSRPDAFADVVGGFLDDAGGLDDRGAGAGDRAGGGARPDRPAGDVNACA
ncbi:MAG: alpha/beta hydrolase [Vicinamibacterales bacterium]